MLRCRSVFLFRSMSFQSAPWTFQTSYYWTGRVIGWLRVEICRNWKINFLFFSIRQAMTEPNSTCMVWCATTFIDFYVITRRNCACRFVYRSCYRINNSIMPRRKKEKIKDGWNWIMAKSDSCHYDKIPWKAISLCMRHSFGKIHHNEWEFFLSERKKKEDVFISSNFFRQLME